MPSRQPLERSAPCSPTTRHCRSDGATLSAIAICSSRCCCSSHWCVSACACRPGTVALRRRAAFEHVIAENSTRLINCPPAETKARTEAGSRRDLSGHRRRNAPMWCWPRSPSEHTPGARMGWPIHRVGRNGSGSGRPPGRGGTRHRLACRMSAHSSAATLKTLSRQPASAPGLSYR